LFSGPELRVYPPINVTIDQFAFTMSYNLGLSFRAELLKYLLYLFRGNCTGLKFRT